MTRLSAILAASCVGLTLGILTGLSSAPVVASVVTAITSLATGAFAWYVNRSDNVAAHLRIYMHSISVYCLFLLAGVFVGLRARTHGLLSPMPAVLVEKWIEAGFLPAQARRLAVTEYLGVQDTDKSDAKGSSPQIMKTVLFSGEETASDISSLQLIVENGKLTEIEDTFERRGGTLAAAVIYVRAEKLTDAEKKTFLTHFYFAQLKGPRK